jgi:hypothetical protein
MTYQLHICPKCKVPGHSDLSYCLGVNCDMHELVYIEVVPKDEVVKDLMDIQAELQTPLGLYRMDHTGKTIEDGLTRTLARCHKLLNKLGTKMLGPATHPEVWDGPECAVCENRGGGMGRNGPLQFCPECGREENDAR